MQCFVYRSSIKSGLYVYLADEDGLGQLPEPVRRQLGQAELALSFELSESRRLSQEDPREVMDNLRRQGFHIQMTDDIEPLLQRVSDEARKP